MFRVVHLDSKSCQSYLACWLRQIYIWRKLTVTDNLQWESSSQMHTCIYRTTATITVAIFVDIFVCIAFRVCCADRCVSMFKNCTRHKQSSLSSLKTVSDGWRYCARFASPYGYSVARNVRRRYSWRGLFNFTAIPHQQEQQPQLQRFV